MDSAPYNTTLQLFLCLLAVVVVACCVIKNLPPKCKDSEGRSNVHLYYLVGIGSLLIIELVTYILTGTGEVSQVILNQISFASTISSILLSVIAIIYSIVSGSKGANLYMKTEEVSKQIGEALPKLNSLGVAVEKLEMLDTTAQELNGVPSAVEGHLEEIKAQMRCMEELSRKMSQKLDNVACDISAMSEPLAGMLNETHLKPEVHPHESKPKNNSQTKALEDVFHAYLKNSSLWGLFLLLTCCYSAKTKKPIVLTEELFGDKNLRSDYLFGYLVASRALGLIRINKIPQDMSIQIDSVYEGFEVEAEVLRLLNGDMKPHSKVRVEECLKVINAYFDLDDK